MPAWIDIFSPLPEIFTLAKKRRKKNMKNLLSPVFSFPYVHRTSAYLCIFACFWWVGPAYAPSPLPLNNVLVLLLFLVVVFSHLKYLVSKKKCCCITVNIYLEKVTTGLIGLKINEMAIVGRKCSSVH